MSGLIYKDLVVFGQQWKYYLPAMLFMGGLSVANKNPNLFGGMCAVYAMIILLGAYGYDEKAGWDKYALTMPVSRARIVLSKYALGLLVNLCGFVLTSLLFLVMKSNVQEMLAAQCVYLTIGLVLMAVQIPLIVKFGVERARLMMMGVILVPTLLLYMLMNSGIQFLWLGGLLLRSYFWPAAGLCLLVVSAALSVWIYKGKEF